MKHNVGKTDKIIRSVIVIVLAYLGYIYHWAFYIVALALLITVISGSCYPYKLLGINTCKVKNPEKEEGEE